MTLYFCKISLVSGLIDCHLKGPFYFSCFSSLAKIYLFCKCLHSPLVFIDLPFYYFIVYVFKPKVLCLAKEKFTGVFFHYKEIKKLICLQNIILILVHSFDVCVFIQF